MRTYKVGPNRDYRPFTDACATVSLMCKESFTIEDEDINTNRYAELRWMNVWWKDCEGPDDMITIELEFETHAGMETERFQTGEFDYGELLTTMLDSITERLTKVGMYDG